MQYDWVIDVGNSRAKIALFDERGLLRRKWVHGDLHRHWLKKKLRRFPPRGLILSSVRKKYKGLRRWLEKRKFPSLYFSPKTALPIKQAYQSPQTLGRDRLAAALGAWYLHPGQASLVFNAGTCLTCDYIDASGEYQGGSISPGLRMRLAAMQHFTKRLPLVSPPPALQSGDFIGRDTQSSLQKGALWGMLQEIEGWASKYLLLEEHLQLFLAGGDAPLLAKMLPDAYIHEADLVLLGLQRVLNYHLAQNRE